MRDGVWFSRDGTRALLVAETLAAGFDIDGQAQAIEAIRDAFSATRRARTRGCCFPAPAFSAPRRAPRSSRKRAGSPRSRPCWSSLILLAVYRAFGPVVLSALPGRDRACSRASPRSSWVFGPVHGITLGFGATLIGEAVDYPSYAFIQAARGERLADTLARIGPTLRLAVLTTVFGASAMALSSFQGLAQLGVLTIVGVGVAGLVTRWVLPALAPAGWVSRKVYALPFDAQPLRGGRAARILARRGAGRRGACGHRVEARPAVGRRSSPT